MTSNTPRAGLAIPIVTALTQSYDGVIAEGPVDPFVHAFDSYRTTTEGHATIKGILELLVSQDALTKITIPKVFDGNAATAYFYPTESMKAELVAVYCGGAVFAGTELLDSLKETLNRVVKNVPQTPVKDFFRQARVAMTSGMLSGLQSRGDLVRIMSSR